MSKKRKVELDSWKAQQFRCTIFPVGGAPLSSGEGMWSKLTGDEPEESVRRPKEQVLVEKGPFLDGLLSLQIGQGKIDWLLQAADTGTEEEIPNLGSFPEAIGSFNDFIEKWFAEMPPVTRVAFGTSLLLSVDDRIAGYKLLSSFIPVEIDAEGSSDFIYRINRPRFSKVASEVKLNRLSTWSVQTVRMVSFNLCGGEVVASTKDAGSTLHAVKLDLDINTSGDNKDQISAEKRLDIYKELCELANEICVYGDIK